MSRFMSRLPIVFVTALLCACRPLPGPVPIDSDGCPQACSRLRALGCDAGRDTEDGAPCEAVCGSVEAFKAGLYHAGCVTNSNTCQAAERCYQ